MSIKLLLALFKNLKFFAISTITMLEKTIHIITQDNIPLLYVDTIEDAKLIMWELARSYRTNWFSNYNTYIREGSNQNKIEIREKETRH